MSYFDRRVQLDNTLESIAKQRVNNVFVIVVDDGSSLPVDVFEKYPFDLEIIRVEPQDKKWTNSEVVLNKGIIRAIEKGAEIVILQNAECRHMGQIIEWPEVVTEGADLDECRALLRDALREMFSAYAQLGKEIPLGNALIEHLPVEVASVGQTA